MPRRRAPAPPPARPLDPGEEADLAEAENPETSADELRDLLRRYRRPTPEGHPARRHAGRPSAEQERRRRAAERIRNAALRNPNLPTDMLMGFWDTADLEQIVENPAYDLNVLMDPAMLRLLVSVERSRLSHRIPTEPGTMPEFRPWLTEVLDVVAERAPSTPYIREMRQMHAIAPDESAVVFYVVFRARFYDKDGPGWFMWKSYEGDPEQDGYRITAGLFLQGLLQVLDGSEGEKLAAVRGIRAVLAERYPDMFPDPPLRPDLE
ncbi:MAG: hypothetical protein IT477_10505 [Rhodanobacteraceae bacterium]|nr:hypothetical protein [Rhodanobacteraceae bacterium]